jgi:aryl-alcohol dehydrogenase-like predicted oxidoreductase
VKLPTPAGQGSGRHAGRASAAGTDQYQQRFTGEAAQTPGGASASRAVREHFRSAAGLVLSSIGCGTYLGELSDPADDRYCAALVEAVRSGCNVLDTAVNYRAQRSEMALGRALDSLLADGGFSRSELVIASKGGFIPYHLARPADPIQYIYDNFITTGVADPDDLAGGIHCMAPNYLSQQIAWSLRNTGLSTLDIYYIHNPETQLAFVDRDTVRKRLQLAFARLEEEVAAGRIGCYGLATWEGLRRPPLSSGYMSLEVMVRLATEVAGPGHHLQVIQLPVSAAITEAVVLRNQAVRGKLLPVLECAPDLGLTVITSASIGQAQLTGRVASLLAEVFPVLETTAQRALQFTRSLPGVTTALVGMSRVEHVRDDLALATCQPEPERAHRLAHALAR